MPNKQHPKSTKAHYLHSLPITQHMKTNRMYENWCSVSFEIKLFQSTSERPNLRVNKFVNTRRDTWNGTENYEGIRKTIKNWQIEIVHYTAHSISQEKAQSSDIYIYNKARVINSNLIELESGISLQDMLAKSRTISLSSELQCLINLQFYFNWKSSDLNWQNI